jgi:hypothetical protein
MNAEPLILWQQVKQSRPLMRHTCDTSLCECVVATSMIGAPGLLAYLTNCHSTVQTFELRTPDTRCDVTDNYAVRPRFSISDIRIGYHRERLSFNLSSHLYGGWIVIVCQYAY